MPLGLTRNRLFLASLILLAVAGVYSGEAVAEIADIRSTSPLNPGSFGTQYFYTDLIKEGYNVRLGGIEDATLSAGTVYYLIIGPDEGFSRVEIGALKKLFDEGRLRILIADETGVLSPLTEELLGAEITGEILRSTDIPKGGWEYLVEIRCGGMSFESFKVSSIIAGAGSTEICRAASISGDYVAGIAAVKGSSLAIVLADSSLFANYLYLGLVGLEPTRQAAQEIFSLLGARPGDTVIFDVEHYRRSRILDAGHAAAYLTLWVSEKLSELPSRAFSRGVPPVAIVGIAASMALTLLLLGVPRRLSGFRGGEEYINNAKLYLKTELRELGKPTEVTALDRARMLFYKSSELDILSRRVLGAIGEEHER